MTSDDETYRYLAAAYAQGGDTACIKAVADRIEELVGDAGDEELEQGAREVRSAACLLGVGPDVVEAGMREVMARAEKAVAVAEMELSVHQAACDQARAAAASE